MVPAASLAREKSSNSVLPSAPERRQRNYYARNTRELRKELAASIPPQELRRLHQVSPLRHVSVAVRQFGLLALASWGLIHFSNPLIWLPLAMVQGFLIFSFTVLLHEIVHENALKESHHRANRILGFLYAILCGFSATQFMRWHLDHHESLGSIELDPERRHLSPKRNSRWVKLLYFTPALFGIYFRAAIREATSYPQGLQRRIRWEQLLSTGAHLSVLAGLIHWFGPVEASRAFLIPYLFVFPVAFSLNLLAQHYSVVPEDPAQWSTLLRISRFWNFAFLWSPHHLEHHYYPRVPFYNLPRLRRLLQPFFDKRGMKPRGYGELLRGYLIDNNTPHSEWNLDR